MDIYSYAFEIYESTKLAGGYIVRSRSRQISVAYAKNIYNSPDPNKELIIWADASWNAEYPKQLAAAAVSFRQRPRVPRWCDLVTLVKGPPKGPFELLAIHQALQVAIQQYPQTAGQQVVKIFTDSQRSMRMLSSEPADQREYDTETETLIANISSLARDLVETGCHLEVHWVKGHSQVIGHERADRLANLARKAFINQASEQIPDHIQYEELELQKYFTKDTKTAYETEELDEWDMERAMKQCSLSYSFVDQRARG